MTAQSDAVLRLNQSMQRPSPTASSDAPRRLDSWKEIAAFFGRDERTRAVARSLEAYGRVIVLDAGCALGLSRSYAEAGVTLAPRVEPLVRLAASRLSALAPVVPSPTEPVRWHDPCQLGRGMGIYDEPRNVLARLLGRPPGEFEDNRDQAICSGGGGLLPSTMPEVARTIAGARLDAHARSGGGRVVTACASSLIALRSRTRGTGVVVDDLVTWIARGLRAGKKRRG